MKLYEISAELENCIKIDDNLYINGETGEVIDLEAIDKLKMDFETKAIHIARWIKNLNAEAEAIKSEKKKLDARQKAAENKAESLTKYLQSVLNGQTVSDSTVKVTYRKSDYVDVNESVFFKSEIANRDQYLKFKDPEISLSAIKSDLKLGIAIPGCEIKERINMKVG